MKRESAPTPQQIGPFRILRALGEDGSGRSYLAEQDEPARRIVLKVLKLRFGSDEDRLRFGGEIERLSRLSQAGIARICESGQLSPGLSGTPYLVMETAPGALLLNYAREQKLDVAGRLRLLAKIARSVHYAHTRGVLDRNLRSARIRVDASGQPRILEYGLARCFGDDDLERLRHFDEWRAALPYLSPEQATGGGDDPRCDVYALGAIAYELLSGAPLRATATHTTLAAALASLPQAPPPLSARLPEARGDLDALLRSALAPSPAKRYASAAEFAADIERYLDHQPLVVRPVGAWTQLKLYMRRHRRAALIVAALMTVPLLSDVALWRYAQSQQRQLLDIRQQRDALDSARRFLEDALTATSGAERHGAPVGLHAMLDRARLDLAADTQLDSNSRAYVVRTLGGAYAALGDADRALSLAQTARPTDPAAREELELLQAGVELLSGDPAAALQRLQPLLAAPAAQTPTALHHWLEARMTAVNADYRAGRLDIARQHSAAVASDALRLLGADDHDTLAAQVNDYLLRQIPETGTAARVAPDAAAEGEALITRLDTTLGSLHPYTLALREARARILQMQGDWYGAETVQRALLNADEQRYGRGHYETIEAQRTLAQMLRAREPASAEAESLLREAWAGSHLLPREDWPLQAALQDSLAHALADRGRDNEALELCAKLRNAPVTLPPYCAALLNTAAAPTTPAATSPSTPPPTAGTPAD